MLVIDCEMDLKYLEGVEKVFGRIDSMKNLVKFCISGHAKSLEKK